MVADLPTAALLDFCDSRSIPASAVLDLEHIADDPHFKAVDLLHDDEHPTEGPYRYTRDPIRFASQGDDHETVRLHAPGLGEHTAQVMAELGWTDEQIATLHP